MSQPLAATERIEPHTHSAGQKKIGSHISDLNL